MMAPVQPMATPLVFFHVMGSPRMRNESTMAKMGIEVVTDAVAIAKEKFPELHLDGELQADAAQERPRAAGE